jgi:adenylate cyclase
MQPTLADEEGTLARLKECRRDLIDPGIARRRGGIVKTTGDGLLIEFSSPVEAVRWAVEMQQGMIDRNADVPEGKRIRFRVGINLGDVIVDDEDLYGDAVNIAARLENPADPGGKCISQTGARADPRPAGSFVRGRRRAERQEHRPPDPRLRPLR